MTAEAWDLEEAHRIGSYEAEQLDQALRDLEQRDIATLTAAHAANRAARARLASDSGVIDSPTETPEHVLQELARLRDFHEKVLTSRSWKLMQALLRAVGRGW